MPKVIVYAVIPQAEGKLRELDVQKTVLQIIRGSDQFTWCCKQLPHKYTSSITKTVQTMDLHTISLSSHCSHMHMYV